MSRIEDTPEYIAGFERGANERARANDQTIARLKFDLAWALLQIEKTKPAQNVTSYIAELRGAWRLDLVGGGVETFQPQLPIIGKRDDIDS